MIQQIQNMSDVVSFATHIVNQGTILHPDTDFRDYRNLASGKPTYRIHEAIRLNRLMDECFRVCRRNKADIYEVMMAVTLKETGLDALIPKP